jgi:glycosyltransferase involved in cell wall biosynthesis
VYPESLRREMRERYPALDAVTVLTQTDLDAYRDMLDGTIDLEQIPNAISRLPGDPPPERDKVILAAGRLTAVKGFDLLIRAFAPVAERHPDWRLVIRGYGEQRPVLERLIAEEGLEDHVDLGYAASQMGELMARSAVFALSSRHEGFGMVLLEAMSKGMAVVSFDCETGPRELIDDDRDGVLVPAEDVAAFTQALLRVIEDPALRERLGAAAREKAGGYGIDVVGARWDALLAAHGAT